MKSLLHRLIGFGRIPPAQKADLTREGLRLIDEAVASTITRINYRDPIQTCTWQKRSLTASIILTNTRLLALNHRGNPYINIPLTDHRLPKLNIQAPRPDLLLIAFDVALFHPDWTGTMECRFRTPLAKSFVKELRPM